MFEPVRGGTRGGQAEFKWADVSADKDRENYLGHSINAPTGRWQKNKDIHWYNRDVDSSAAERAEEIRKVKELEADALAVALGFEPAPKTVAPLSPTASTKAKSEPTDNQRALEKAEKRRRKAERKEKRLYREKRRFERGGRHATDDSGDDGQRRHVDRSRSRSPRRRSTDKRDYSPIPAHRLQSRSRTPPKRDQSARARPSGGDYDTADREKERERGHRRWESGAKREQPSGMQWGRR